MNKSNVLKSVVYGNDWKNDIETIIKDVEMIRMKLVREQRGIDSYYEQEGFNSQLVQLHDSTSNSLVSLYAHSGSQLTKNLLVSVVGPRQDELYTVIHEFLIADKYFIADPKTGLAIEEQNGIR